MAAPRRKQGIQRDCAEVLPDGPLQQILSLVRDPHRQNLRLVCRRFCNVEAQTRSRLVFRVPQPTQKSSRSPSPSSRVGKGESTSDADGDRASPAATIPDSESENEAEECRLVKPTGSREARLSQYVSAGGSAHSSGVQFDHDTSIVHSTTVPPTDVPVDLDVDEKCPKLSGRSSADESCLRSSGNGMTIRSCGAGTGLAPVQSDSRLSTSPQPLLAAHSCPSDAESSRDVTPKQPRCSGRRAWTGLDGEQSEDDVSTNREMFVRIRRADHATNSYPTASAQVNLCKPDFETSIVDGKHLTPQPVPAPGGLRMAETPKLSLNSPHSQLPSLMSTVHAPTLLPLQPVCSQLGASYCTDEAERASDHPSSLISAEDKLSRLLKRFPQLRCLEICGLHPGAGGGRAGSALDFKLLTVVSLYASSLEELHLSGQSLGWMVDDAGLVAVARGCPKLRKLVIHHWVVGRQGMAAIADTAQLQELEMDFFARDQASGPHRTVTEIARCRSLTALHLRYCNNEDVRELAEGCPSLTRLTLLFSVLGSSFATLGRNCRSLKELTLRSCDTNMFDDPLASLAQHCSSLQSLSLHAGHVATETGLLSLITACPQLTKLSLEFKPLPMRLVNIAEHLSGLKELTLQWIQADDEDLVALSRHCKHLNILVLSLLQNVTDAGIQALLQGCGASLEVVLLRVRDASDSVLKTLGTSCPSLQRLTLALPRVTSSGLSAMLEPEEGQDGRLMSLRRLRLWDCSSLSDEALDCIEKHCPNLEGLGIKGCTGLHPIKLRDMVQSCAKLDHLEVERCFFPFVQCVADARGIDLVEAV